MKNSEIQEILKRNQKADPKVLRSRIGPGADQKKPNLNDVYGQWNYDLISQALERNLNGEIPCQEHFAACCFFQTMTFDREAIRKRKAELRLSNSSYDIEWDDFHRVYCGVSRQLIGRNWTRPKYERELPMAIVSLDFDGTRYSRELEGQAKNAHFHIIWVVPPKLVSRFTSYFNLIHLKKFYHSLHLDNIRTENYDPSRSDIRKLATYAQKAMVRTQRDPIEAEMLRIYPNKNYTGSPYRTEHSYERRNWRTDRLRDTAFREARSTAYQTHRFD